MGRGHIVGPALCALALLGCGDTVRRSGQVELFTIDETDGVAKLERPRRTFTSREVTYDQARLGPGARVDPMLGDLVRFTSDSIMVTVPSVYLDHLPVTLSGALEGRYDALLFSEVWENAAADRSAPSINRVVCVALDQRVPGRLNFQDAIAYGPTNFKGNPIRMKFTLVLLQKRAQDKAESAASTLESFLTLTGIGLPAGATASATVGLIRQIVRSLPDVEAFDFEVTWIPYRPPEAERDVGGRRVLTVGQALERIKTNSGGPSDTASSAQAIRQLVTVERRAVGEQLLLKLEELIKPTAELTADQATALRSEVESAGLDTEKAKRLANAITPAIVTSPDAQKELRAAVAAVRPALELKTVPAFIKVREGLERLALATDAIEAKAAVETIQACNDFPLIRNQPIELASIVEELNARPWLRYGMFACVETAHYPSGAREPIAFDVNGATLTTERLGLQAAPPASPGVRGPNWLLADVIPNMIVEDHETLRAASEAADALLRDFGYVDPRRIAGHPQTVERRFDDMRDGIFETMLARRADSLALDLAREARAETGAVGDVFRIGGPFDQRYTKLLEQFAAETKDNRFTSDQRWKSVGEMVRDRFHRRFPSPAKSGG